jgi:hypothetical protein
MSVQIPVSFVDQFKANFLMLSQEKQSKLRMSCRMEDVTGDTMYVERIGATEMQEMTTRHGDTPQIDTPHSRRRLMMSDYNWADMIDKADKLKMLADPQSSYTQNALFAANRQIDDVIITALGGPAYAGHQGGTTVNNYDVDECRLVGSDGAIITAGSNFTNVTETDLTIAKLLTCKELLDNADIDPDRQRYFLTNPHNINALLNTTEVKSSDYNTVKALAQGQIDTYMGFKFIPSTRLPADGTDTDATNCYAFAQGAIVLAVSLEPMIRVSERADKNYSIQVYLQMSLGATRVEGPAVVEINLNTA